jgi:lysozyme family protein
MQKNLKESLDDLIDSEGGWTLADSEPGGASNWGISMTTWTDYCLKHSRPQPTLDDLKALTKDQAEEFYTEEWDTQIDFNDLPIGVDYRLLDISVNLGVTGGINLLQSVIEVPITGKIDPTTKLALKAFSDRKSEMILVVNLGNAWLDLKKKAPHWNQYWLGWTIRAYRVTTQAITMITRG